MKELNPTDLATLVRNRGDEEIVVSFPSSEDNETYCCNPSSNEVEAGLAETAELEAAAKQEALEAAQAAADEEARLKAEAEAQAAAEAANAPDPDAGTGEPQQQ